MPEYTAEHAKAGIDAPLPAIETWPNQFPDYEITVEIPEYNAICPKTGLPDFGHLTIVTSRTRNAWSSSPSSSTSSPTVTSGSSTRMP